MLLYLLKINKKVITSWTFGRREKNAHSLNPDPYYGFVQLLFYLFRRFQDLVRIFLTCVM